MSDDESSSFDTSESYVSSESKKTPTRSSERKRKYEELVTRNLSRRRLSESSNTGKKNHYVTDIFFPNYLFSFVRKDSLERALTVIENEEYLTLEEINKPDKFNLCFELLNIELYPNKDLAILRVRDGTICPSSVLCLPNSANWESLERSIIKDPVCRSDLPIVDLLLYNSSFSLLTFKEFYFYRMKNVMAVKGKTIDNKSLILCANGKDAYTTRMFSSNQIAIQISSRTDEKKYQEIEEKYLQFISPKILKQATSNSHTVMPKKLNNTKKGEITKKISVKGKIRKSNIEDSEEEEEEEEEEDRIENKRTKLKVGKVQTGIKNSVKVVKDGNKIRKASNSLTPNSRTSLKKLTIDEDYDESHNRSPHNIRKLKINSELETEEEDRKLYQTKKGNEIAKCKKNMTHKTKEERTSLKKLRIDENFNKSRNTLPQNLRKVNKDSYLETEEDSEEDKDSNEEEKGSDKEATKLHTSKKANEISNKKTIIPKTRKENTSLKKQIFDEFSKRSPCNLKEVTKDSELDKKLFQTKKNYENARSKLIMTPKTKEERLSLTKLKSGKDEKRRSGNVKKSNKNVELEMEEQDSDDEEQYSEEEGEDSDEEASRLHKTNEIVNKRTITPKTSNNKILLNKRNFDESRKRSPRYFRKVKKYIELETEEDSDEEDNLYQYKKDNKNVRSKQIVTLKTEEERLSPRKLKSSEDDKKSSGNVTKLNKKVQLETEEDIHKKVKIQYEIKKGNEITRDKKTMTSETNEESPLLRKLKSNENDNTIWKSVSKDIKKLSKKFSSETEEEICVEEVNKTKRTDEIEKDKEVLILKTNLKSRTEGFSGDGDLAKSRKSKGEIKNNKDNTTGTKNSNILATTKVESEKTSIIEKWNQYEDNSSKERRNLNSPKKIHYSCKKVTTLRSKVNVDLVTYKTISELNSEHDCVNTFGIIINILKENNKISKWRIAVEIIDQTQEKPPLKIYLFLPQRALISLNNVIKLHQVIELVGLKVGKFNRAITGRVFAANQIELYDSNTGQEIEWRDLSSKLNESESTLEIITNLRSWFKDKQIQSEENVNEDQSQKLSSNKSQVAELDLGDIEHIQKRASYPRKKNSDEAKDNPLQLKTREKSIDKISSSVLNEKKSCLYNMLHEIVPKENIDEVKLLTKISCYKFYELKDLTEEDKFNMIIEVVNIHRYDEVNLDVIQVMDETRCTLPMLHIPLENSWSIAKKKILCNPSYTSDSPVVDILCFESQPYLLMLQVGKRYKIYNCLVMKTQLSGSSNEMDRYVICVEGKDCEAKCASRIKTPEKCLRNKGEKKAAESSVLPSVFQQSKDYPESLRPLECDQSEKEKATTSHIEKKQIGVQDVDSTTPSLIDLDETDGIHTDIPFGKEIDSMMREESALGLPVTLSEDIHLKNSGSDPTYSQFAIHANKRSKLFKTSTQTFEREPMVCTLSTINSNNAQHLDSTDLLNVNPTVLNENIVYSPDSMESLRLELDEDEISNNGRTDNNDNIDDDELSNAGSESILSHRYRDRCLIDLDLTDKNVKVINEKKNVNKEKILLEKESKASSSSDLEIVELNENITPKKGIGSLSNSKNSSATKDSPIFNKFLNNPLKEQPKLLIHAMLEKKFKLPSRCFYKSGNRAEDSSDDSSESEDEDEGPEDTSAFTLDSHNYITTVTDYPDLPVMPIRTFLEIRNTNSHCYTTIPLKLSPELEDGWEEKAVHCICSKCNKTYVLSDVNKIVSEESDNWPNQKVPVCPLDGCPLKSASASFHFEFEIKLVKFSLTCTALLVSKSAETFLDCSVMEFLNCAKKRQEVKSRLKHLFLLNKTENTNTYNFNLTRKNMFDVSPGPFYIKDIQLK